jgi:nucleoside-diphosphate kinase
MNEHPKKERTLVVLKPDAIQRSLIGELIKRFENTGLKMRALKMMIPSEDLCWKHYNKDKEWFLKKGKMLIKNRQEKDLPIEKEAVEYGKGIIDALVKFMTAGPVIAMIFSGNQAVGIVKKLVGGTEPLTSDVGTIRGDFTLDSYQISNFDNRAVRNLVHCSDSTTEAQREIDLWFKKEEIMSYRLVAEHILYDVDLDGLKE